MSKSPTELAGEALADRVLRLGRHLQTGGIEVALSEVIDAANAVAAIDIGSRSELREALRVTMVKQPRHYAQFEAAFDRLFPARPPRQKGAARSDRSDPDDRAEQLSSGDVAGLATTLVQNHAGLEDDLRSERHHMQRVLRAADLANLMTLARELDPAMSVADLQARIEELKRLIAAELRAHLGADDGDAHSDSSVEDLEFLEASRAELDEIRAAIKPLARKLASRLARRRQHRRSGRVDLRRTTRLSLSTGGVPLDLAFRRARMGRPELYVLCDISGSVAEFSVFTLTLMAALSEELAKTRSFVFVDAIDEISELLESTDHGIEPWQILRNSSVIGDSGHSDYGNVFRQFWDEFGERDLRPTSTVLITGDARCNYRDPDVDALTSIARRARRVYWLNPEPRDDWHLFDSEMSAYSDVVGETFEVRTLRQLVRCVEVIL